MYAVYIPSEGYSLQKEMGFKSENNFSTEKIDMTKLSSVKFGCYVENFGEFSGRRNGARKRIIIKS